MTSTSQTPSEMITRISMNTEKEREIIFFADGEPITDGMFSKALQEIGLREGDTIFVHSDLLAFGDLIVEDSRKTLTLIVRALQEVVGMEGTIIIPTFTYSFLSEAWSGPLEVFDVERSPSKTGALTEYFRKQPNVIRTDHPTHSVAIWGSRKGFYSDIGDSTFGKDSIFGKLHAENAKLVGLGFPMPGTFTHYIEKQVGVPYRVDAILVGKVIRNGRTCQKQVKFFQKKKNYSTTPERFINKLRSTHKVKISSLGDGEVSAIDARIAFEEGTTILRKNPYYFAKKITLIDKSVSRLKAVTKALLRL